MSGITLKATDESLIPTPPTDKATLFLDDTSGEPSYKDDTGVTTSLKGAAGAHGAGVPVGGATGQVLAKIDGTDYNTQWITPSGGGSGTVTSVAYSFDATLADLFSVSGSPVTTSGTLTASAVDGGADVLLFWDDSAGKMTYLTLGTNLSITGTTINASGGGGLTNWTEGLNSTSPNNVIPVATFLATGAAPNIDAQLPRPKGQGALVAQVPDGTATGGNKRGVNAVDLQYRRSSASQVASGANSFAAGGANTVSGDTATGLGDGCTASGNYSVAAGSNAQATATNATAIGSNVTASAAQSTAVGRGCTASAQGATALGQDATADGVFSVALGSNARTRGIRSATAMVTNSASMDDIAVPLYGSTTNATPKALSVADAGVATNTILVLQNTTAVEVEGYVVARQNTTGDAAAWKFSGLIKRGANAAATAIVGSITPVSVAADSGASTWAVAVTADTTNGGLAVTVTGEASKTIKWACKLTSVHVIG